MEISFSEQDGVTVAALSGRLDSATSGEAQQALASGLDGCGRLLLDLEKVAYVSSAGLRVFLMLAKQSRAAAQITEIFNGLKTTLCLRSQ